MSTAGIVAAIYLAAIPCFILSIASLASSVSANGIFLAECTLLLVSIAALLLTTVADTQITIVTWLLGTLVGVPLTLMVPLMAGSESAGLSWLSLSNTIGAAGAVGALSFLGNPWATAFATVGVTAAIVNVSGCLITAPMLKMLKKDAN